MTEITQVEVPQDKDTPDSTKPAPKPPDAPRSELPLSRRLKLPPNFRDVTQERIGKVVSITGVPKPSDR